MLCPYSGERMMRSIILISLLSSMAGSAVAGVYECNLQGKTIFQSKPCTGHIGVTVGERIKENEAKNETRPKYQAEYSYYYDTLPKPVIGMSLKEAEKTQWGRPSRVSKSTSTRDAIETWYFAGESYYDRKELRFRNGYLIEVRE